MPYTLCILSSFRERPSINSILKKPFIQKKVSKFLPEHVSVNLHLSADYDSLISNWYWHTCTWHILVNVAMIQIGKSCFFSQSGIVCFNLSLLHLHFFRWLLMSLATLWCMDRNLRENCPHLQGSQSPQHVRNPEL